MSEEGDVRDQSERVQRAHETAAKVREILVAIARAGTSGWVQVNQKEGRVTTVETRLITGDRTEWSLPDLSPAGAARSRVS